MIGRRQAIIWTNALILLIGPLGTIFSEILIGAFPNPEIKALSLIQLNTSGGRRNM